jgi:hypothetical protein
MKRIWSKVFLFLTGMALLVTMAWTGFSCHGKMDTSTGILNSIGVTRGICVLLGDRVEELAISLAQESDLLIYLQLPSLEDVNVTRHAVDSAGLYGRRIFVDKGPLSKLHLADNLADAIIAVGEEPGLSE